MKRVFFIHEGKASYPELAAYREHLESRFEVGEGSRQEAARLDDLSSVIAWHIMGFCPRPLGAGFTIHDYRSLSVAPLARLKDRVKRRLNHRPDLRIFLNERIRDEMAFRDDVPCLEIDMGVPEMIRELRDRHDTPEYDFCYIGEISRERQCERMLGSFLERFGSSRSFVLVGRADEELKAKFAGHERLSFTGRIDQRSALDYVARSRVAVCYFPSHRPHCFQTPTKLLEYAAMGKPILINDSPSNLATAKRYGIRVFDGGRDLFSRLEDPSQVPNNEHVDARSFEWPALLEQSGIRERLERIR